VTGRGKRRAPQSFTVIGVLPADFRIKRSKIRGVESRGMLLAAGEAKALGLLTVDGDVPVGTKIR